MGDIRTMARQNLARPAIGRVFLQVVLLPPYLAFLCLLFGIDAICSVLTCKWSEPRK